MALPADDLMAIYKLMADYNHLVDAGRGDDWADLFVEGGSLDTGMGMVIEGGRDALAEFAASVPTLVPGARHVVSNISIDGDGSTATGSAYLQMWATAADASQAKLVITGVYRDELRKVDGSWRFVKRVMTADQGTPR